MANDNTPINLDAADITVSYDSDARTAERPISLRAWQMVSGQPKQTFCLELSPKEATDIAGSLKDSVAFAERVREIAGGEL
ncbi:hypothetical protein [Marinobacter subterrani]|uniref:Uncharacterized protein n=1 Tax=Marinobacter subterrani TaxID=1658765 RepID=A0A0J7J7Z0_9GAMM|nr:hypothetical protein [Marinobacter subterrani]KMQ74031.1 hypothetical protein Msub_10202 [Marinobacter subterrani]